MRNKQTTFFWLIIGILCINLLVNNHSITLWDEDEAAYAGFAERMYEGASWVNPEYEWSRVHRKIPLHFWAIACSYHIFGVNEFAVRFPGALAILLTCLSVFFLGRPIFGAALARWAAIILSTSIVLPIMGKIGLTDATLLLSQTIAVLGLLNFVLVPQWKWLFLLWGGIALGVMAKGPPILILTGGLWIWLAIFHPQRKNLIKTHPWIFGIIALLPFAAWCYLSYQEDYALWQASGDSMPFAEWWQLSFEERKIHVLPFLWDWYILKRVGGSVLGQTAPPGFHLGIILAAFLTWLPFVLPGIWHLARKFFQKGRSSINIMLAGWLLFAWLFYELMPSKSVSYTLGVQPAIAFLIAQQLELWREKEAYPYRKLLLGGGILYAVIFGILVLTLPFVAYHFLGDIVLWRTILFSILLGGLLIYLAVQTRKNKEKAVKGFVYVGAGLMFLLWTLVAPIAEHTPIKALKKVSEVALSLDKNKKAGQKSTVPVYVVAPNVKQSKISLLVYINNSFETCENIIWEEAIEHYMGEKQVILILGLSAIEAMNILLKERGIEKGLEGVETQEVDFWSLDDQLKSNPYLILTNQ